MLIMSQDDDFTTGLQGFKHYRPSWKVTMYIFPPHKKFPPKTTIVHINLQELFSLVLTLSSYFAGPTVRVTCSMVCLVSVWERVNSYDIYYGPVTVELTGPFYCHASATAGLISKGPRVSGDLQHQTSVTQTSLWFLYAYFMLVFFFLSIHFPGKTPYR